MLELVHVGPRSIKAYRGVAPDAVLDDLVRVASQLLGARVLHVNATPYGGGVSELLRSGIPLLHPPRLLRHKKIHNGLQGAPEQLTEDERRAYLETSAENAALLEEQYDFVFLHDPQAAPIAALHGRGDARWIWRCHIDTSAPNAAT